MLQLCDFQISTFHKYNHKPTKMILKSRVLCYKTVRTPGAGNGLLTAVPHEPGEAPYYRIRGNSARGTMGSSSAIST